MVIRTRLAICASLFLTLFLLHAPNAAAYGIASGLSYDAPSGQLNGFSATWKDWWDEDTGSDCSDWEYDPEYEQWQCESWVYWENWVSVAARLYTPSGGLYGSGQTIQWSLAELDLNPFTPLEDGTWTEVADHYQLSDVYVSDGQYWYYIGTNTYYLGQTAAQADATCPIPIGESSSFEGWFGDPATQAGYRQTLSPASPGVNLGGRRVIETDGAYNPAYDTCWFPGSPIPQSYTLSGGSWLVGGDNTWGRDYVGWPDVSQLNYPISTYRALNRAPCQTTVPQVMVIQCGTFNQPYYQAYSTSYLQLGFNSTLVWSERLGAYRDRAY